MQRALLISCLLIFTINTNAQDRYLAYTYTTNVLPKGAIDIEGWHTSRFGHSNQFFHAQDQRLEIEVGLGGNLQTAFYFNRYMQRYSESDTGTILKNETGFSNEWKWRVKQPVGRKTGIALYGEWGIKGGDELEIETKLILDKTIRKNLFAFNAVFEYEKEFEWEGNQVKSNGWALPVELDFGWLYNVSPTVGLGIECRDYNAIDKDNGWKYSVFAAGPTVNIRGNNFFIIANYLPQWRNLHHSSSAPFNKVLDDAERAEARILFGISIR